MPPPKIQLKASLPPEYEEHPELLGNLTALIMISVGQPYHEGEVFLESMKYVKGTFARFVIIVADGLQCWTMAIPVEGADPESFREAANKAGKDWVLRNQKAIDVLGSKLVGVIHWDEITSRPEFKKELGILQELHKTGKTSIPPGGGASFEQFAKIFFDKTEQTVKSRYGAQYKATVGYSPVSRFADMTREYTIEETSSLPVTKDIGLLLNNPEMIGLKGDVHLYPTKLNAAMNWQLERINGGKRIFRILLPITIEIEEESKRKAIKSPSTPDVGSLSKPLESTPVPVMSTSVPTMLPSALSLFGTQAAAASTNGSVVKLELKDIADLSVLTNESADVTALLNGKYAEYQRLLLYVAMNRDNVPREVYIRIIRLRDILICAANMLKASFSSPPPVEKTAPRIKSLPQPIPVYTSPLPTTSSSSTSTMQPHNSF